VDEGGAGDGWCDRGAVVDFQMRGCIMVEAYWRSKALDWGWLHSAVLGLLNSSGMHVVYHSKTAFSSVAIYLSY